VSDAVDLAQREKACCPFFEFAIHVDATTCWLVVRVPPEASAVLADLAGLVPRPLRVPAERSTQAGCSALPAELGVLTDPGEYCRAGLGD
jgi:hypothetical protein